MRKKLACVLLLFLPLCTFGQYIGHPAGKAFPLGVVHRGLSLAYGYAGVEGGYTDLDVDATYDTTSGVLREESKLEDSYFALYAGAHARGLEIEARIGGSFQNLGDTGLAEDPFEDGGGLLLGAGARWGFSPVEPLRIGFGGQFSYVYSEGDAVVSDGIRTYRRDIDLDLWRGQLFGGLGVDLPAGRDVTVSPYLGAGVEFLDADLEIRHWDSCCYTFREHLGDFDEDHLELFFGGVDVFFTEVVRLGVEGRGNGAGWGVAASIGWRF